jgi:hypothetical protein
VIDCVEFCDIVIGEYDTKYPWLRDHEHANGPWCWILANIKRITPVSYRGAQKLFDIDASLFEA